MVYILLIHFEPALRDLKSRMIYDDIQRYAADLHTLALENSNSELLAWSVQLQRTAKSFDVDLTNALLSQLEDFFQQLKAIP